MDHQSGKIKTESHSGVFVRGLRIPPGFSPCKTHSREMAQTRILSYTSSQPQYPSLSDASNEGWDDHLEQNSTLGLWSPQEKGLHINLLELKAVFLALRHFKDQCCDGQLNCGSLHKQTRRRCAHCCGES